MADDTDILEDGDPTTVTFHKRSAVIGGVLALLLGGMLISLSAALFPESRVVAAVGKVFAGGVCASVEEQANRFERAIVCYQTGSKIQGIDDKPCRDILNGTDELSESEE